MTLAPEPRAPASVVARDLAAAGPFLAGFLTARERSLHTLGDAG